MIFSLIKHEKDECSEKLYDFWKKLVIKMLFKSNEILGNIGEVLT